MDKIYLEPILKFVKKGDAEGVINWTLTLSKSEKSKLSPALLKELKKYYEYDSNSLFEHHFLKDSNRDSRLAVLKTCLYATANLTLLKKSPWYSIPSEIQLARIIQLTTPTWVDDWIHWLLNDNPGEFWLVKNLHQQGFCSKPTSDNYILGMVQCLLNDKKVEGTLYDCLLANKDLLEQDIWKIFEIEGGGEFSLAAKDKYVNEINTWSATLKRLADEKILPRNRLLDESLNALEKDFAQFRAGWYSRFFVALAPTIDEIHARHDKLLFLLDSQIKPTISFALKYLQQLEKKKRLDADTFIKAVDPVLTTTTKMTVMTGLKVLESICKRQHSAASAVSHKLVKTLYMENADVQNKVFALLNNYGRKDDRLLIDALDDMQEFIVPSLKTKLCEWTGKGSFEEAEIDSDFPNEAIELNNVEEVAAIESFDELVEQLSQVIESPDEPSNIERVIDGLYRFRSGNVESFVSLAAPLHKRVKQIVSRGEPKWVQYHLALAVLSILEKQNHLKPILQDLLKLQDSEFEHVIVARFFYLVEEVIANSQSVLPLISLPSNTMGFICPEKLVQRMSRLCASGEEMPELERVLTILRLDKNSLSSELLAAVSCKLTAMDTEFTFACAYALGADVQLGHTQSLWIAAATIRNPDSVTPEVIAKFGDLGPNTGSSVQYKTWVKTKTSGEYTFYDLKIDVTPQSPNSIPLEHLAVLFHRNKDDYYNKVHFGQDKALVRWGSTIMPGNLEPYFACGAVELDITWAEAQWHVQSFFEPLLAVTVPFKPMARLLLIAGLSSKEQGQRGITIDILIAAIDDGRFKYEVFAEQMAGLATTGIIIVSRWTKALKEISAVSNRHAEAVRKLIQSLLVFKSDDSPRELGGLLELLYELSVMVNKPLDVSHAIDFMKNNTKGGKQKTYSLKLLAL